MCSLSFKTYFKNLEASKNIAIWVYVWATGSSVYCRPLGVTVPPSARTPSRRGVRRERFCRPPPPCAVSSPLGEVEGKAAVAATAASSEVPSSARVSGRQQQTTPGRGFVRVSCAAKCSFKCLSRVIPVGSKSEAKWVSQLPGQKRDPYSDFSEKFSKAGLERNMRATFLP